MLCLLGFANKESGIMVSSIGTVFFIKFVNNRGWNGVHTDSAVISRPKEGQ